MITHRLKEHNMNTQTRINKLLAQDDYLNALAKECLSDAATAPRKMLESVKDLAADMFMVRVEDETPLDNVTYDVCNIRKAFNKF